MYCSACGNQLSAGISFCNRCGASQKERSESKTAAITAFLTAITLIGVIGLGIMLGGALTLKRDANLGEDVVGFFMFFTFLIVSLTEILLVRQLSKLTAEPKQNVFIAPPSSQELSTPQARALPEREPIPSVTENTTRTLEYSRKEPVGR